MHIQRTIKLFAAGAAALLVGGTAFAGPILIDQGKNRTPIWTLSGSQTVEAFYKYGSPKGASANTPLALEKSETSRLFFYFDTTNKKLSLVLIHDKPGNSNGGRAKVEIKGLPASATIAVKDDPGVNNDPASLKLGTANFKWVWNACCTDGAAIAGIGDKFDLTLSFSEVSGLSGWEALSKHPSGRIESIKLDFTKPLRLVSPGAPAGRK